MKFLLIMVLQLIYALIIALFIKLLVNYIYPFLFLTYGQALALYILVQLLKGRLGINEN